MDTRTCLLLLELSPPLTPVRVQRAYRRMVKRWHPDQFADQPAILAMAEERLKWINQAYATLKDHIRDQPAAKTDPDHYSDLAGRNAPPAPGPGARTAFIRPQSANQTAQRAIKPSGSTSAGGQRRSSPQEPLSGFQRIMRAADQTDIASGRHGAAGARALPRRYPIRRRNKGLRVEGTRPFSPLQPVRAVSGIRPIEGSD